MRFYNQKTGEIIDIEDSELARRRGVKQFLAIQDIVKSNNFDAMITLILDYSKLIGGVCPACLLRKLFKYFLKILRQDREVSYISVLERKNGYYHLHILAKGIKENDIKTWKAITDRVGGNANYIPLSSENSSRVVAYACKGLVKQGDNENDHVGGRKVTTSRDIKIQDVEGEIEKDGEWVCLDYIGSAPRLNIKAENYLCVHGYFIEQTELFFIWVVKKYECSRHLDSTSKFSKSEQFILNQELLL